MTMLIPYVRKALAAAGFTAAAFIGAAMLDGALTGGEVVAGLGTGLAAGAATYRIPNRGRRHAEHRG